MTELRTLVAPGVLRGVGLDDIGDAVFTLGQTMPTPENVGAIGSDLEVFDPTGEMRTYEVRTNGQKFEGIDFGNVRLVGKVATAEIDTCRWRITDNRTPFPIIDLNSLSISDWRIRNVTIENLDQLGWQWNPIEGHHFQLVQSLIRGSVDGVRANRGGGWEILGSYIGDLGWWASEGTPYLNSGNQTHSDCIQTTYGGGKIIGNTLAGYASEVVGTGTPGSGSESTPGAWYTQAQAEARRAQLLVGRTPAGKSLDGRVREVGGYVTPLMCTRDATFAPASLDLVVTDNWFAGGGVQVNALNANLGNPVGMFLRNRHFNDSFYTAAGQAMGYRVREGLEAVIPTSGDDVNVFMDGSGVVPRIS